jgi:hypothetical protein
VLRQHARSVAQNCETEPENGPDSRTTWWSRKRDRGLRPELYPKGSFVSKSYTEWSFVVAVRRRRGPVFGTRIWSSKWDRKLLHGRAKTATVVSIFGHWGLAILCVCGAVPRPPFADPCPPLNPSCTRARATRGAAKQWGAALAWRARRARGHAPRDREQCRFSALPPCSCPTPRSCFGDRFGCPFIVEFARGCACHLHVCSSLGVVQPGLTGLLGLIVHLVVNLVVN